MGSVDRVWVRVGVRSGLGRGGRTVEEGGVHGEAGVREETPPLEEGPETAEVCVSGGRASKRQRRPAKKFDAGWGNDAHEIKAAIKKSLLEQTHTRTISVEIPEALVFYPTPAEFANPLEYIRKLAEQNVGTRTGIVKVVPPPGHAPPLDLNSFPQVPFGTKRQTLQKLTQGETFGEGTRHTHATYRAQALKFQRNFRKRFGHLLRGAHSDLSSAADVKVECSKTPKASSKGGGAAQATGSVVAGTSTSAVVAEALNSGELLRMLATLAQSALSTAK